jgi:hypothetical protein
MADDLEALYGAPKKREPSADHPAKDYRLTHRAGSVTICRLVSWNFITEPAI